MVGPIDQMALWQQFTVFGGLFAALTLLLVLPEKSPQLQSCGLNEYAQKRAI